MDAEAVEEWGVRCHMPQPSSKSRQTVGASHALPLVEVPTAGPPAVDGAAGRAAANLVCAYPVQSGHRGDRTTLPSESYINAQKTVTTGQPLGIYQGLSKNLRPSPNQHCESGNVLECTQPSILHSILRLDRVAKNCHQSAINQLAMAANQLLESLRFPAPRFGDQSRIRVLHFRERGCHQGTLDGTASSRRKMHFILCRDQGGLKIRLDPQPHLEGVCEIVESNDHLTFQNLFLGEPKCLKVNDLLTGELRETNS